MSASVAEAAYTGAHDTLGTAKSKEKLLVLERERGPGLTGELRKEV